MSRAIQASFDDPRVKKHQAFGGTLLKKAKNRHDRPVSSKHPMHLVLKSTQAKGRFGFGTSVNAKKIRSIVDDHCTRYGVKKIQYSNNFNHLHLMVKFPSRRIYLKFIRSLTASIALAVSGASKLKSLKSIFGGKKFWDFRPYSRVVFGWRGIHDRKRLRNSKSTRSARDSAEKKRQIKRPASRRETLLYETKVKELTPKPPTKGASHFSSTRRVKGKWQAS
jgi:REP element-mobilizing transposase RayT